MDTSNWGHTQLGDSSVESSDWRSQLQADLRERMVNRIMDAMKSHSQVSGNEGLQELEKRAVSFEEKVYIAATSQSEYMRKICFKILTIETTSQNSIPEANTVNPSAFTFNHTVGNSSTEYDWRAQLQADSRQRIVNKIMDTLKRHLPFSGHEGLQELKKIAVRFEEKIYTAATSQSDYLRKISLQMLTMETRSQNPQHDQQLLSQTMHNNMVSSGMQASSSLSSVLPPGTGLQQSSISNFSNQNPTLQNIQRIQQNSVGNQMGPGVGVGVVPSNNFQNQRQIPGRQQPLAPQQQQQQQQSQNSHYLYQQQQLQQIAKQKLQVQQGNITPSMQLIQSQQLQSSQPLMNHQQLRQQQQQQQQVQPTQQQVQVQPTQSNPMGQQQQQPNATNMQQNQIMGQHPMESGDWRAQLQADSRQRIVNKILDTMKRHVQLTGHEGLQELEKIADRFEDRIYTTATSQSDYLRKISLKMLTMETRSHDAMRDIMIM